MRKSIVLAVSLLFLVASAFAQQPSRSNSITVFATDLSLTESSVDGTRFGAAYGASFDHMFSKHLSGELSVTNQRVRRFATTLDSAGLPTTFIISDHLYPIDATVSYHFLTDSRWRPYVGTGIRYVSDSFFSSGPSGSHRFSTRTVNPEVSGGVIFQFNPTLGLRLDAKQVLGGNAGSVSDRGSKASVGLTFRF
jgi:outer membrane protein W